MSAPTSVLEYMQMHGQQKRAKDDVDNTCFESEEMGIGAVEEDVEHSYLTGENRSDEGVSQISISSSSKTPDRSKAFGKHALRNLSASLPLQRSHGLGFHSKEVTSSSASTTKNDCDGLTRTQLRVKPFKESPKSTKPTSRTDIKLQRRLPFSLLDGNTISHKVANALIMPKKRRHIPSNPTQKCPVEQPTHQEKSSLMILSQYIMLLHLTPLVNAATSMIRTDAETFETASHNDTLQQGENKKREVKFVTQKAMLQCCLVRTCLNLLKKRQRAGLYQNASLCSDKAAKLTQVKQAKKPTKPGLAALSITRQLSRLQSKKQTQKQTQRCSNDHDDNSISSEVHDSMEDDEFDLFGFLNAENVHGILSDFFREVDIEDEIHEFQSNLEEEVKEIWQGIKSLQENLTQALSDGDVGQNTTESQRENERLQHNSTDTKYMAQSQMLEDEPIFGEDVILQQVEEIERLLADLHEVSTHEQQKIAELANHFTAEVNDTMSKIQATTKAIAGEISDDVAVQYKQLQNVKVNDAMHKMLETILVDLHEISKLSISDIVERQSQVLGKSSCGLDLLGHEMQAFLVSREEDEFVADYPKFRAEVKMLTEEAAVAETEAAVKDYWLTVPGEELEEF